MYPWFITIKTLMWLMWCWHDNWWILNDVKIYLLNIYDEDVFNVSFPFFELEPSDITKSICVCVCTARHDCLLCAQQRETLFLSLLLPLMGNLGESMDSFSHCSRKRREKKNGLKCSFLHMTIGGRGGGGGARREQEVIRICGWLPCYTNSLHTQVRCSHY